MDFFQLISLGLAIVIAITLHEYAHAIVAYKLGDPTPKLQGRLTINPRKHFDPIGAMMIVYASLAGIGFGWGKPVMINPYNFKNPQKDELIVAMAGPAMNFCIAAIAAFFIHYVNVPWQGINEFLMLLIQLNIGLMLFNLIPIPPLDGSKVFAVLFPITWRNHRMNFERYGGMVLLFVIFFAKGLLWWMLSPLYKMLMMVLGF
jgi:Zn-dependent protease